MIVAELEKKERFHEQLEFEKKKIALEKEKKKDKTIVKIGPVTKVEGKKTPNNKK